MRYRTVITGSEESAFGPSARRPMAPIFVFDVQSMVPR
jgi:hypothetical protein